WGVQGRHLQPLEHTALRSAQRKFRLAEFRTGHLHHRRQRRAAGSAVDAVRVEDHVLTSVAAGRTMIDSVTFATKPRKHETHELFRVFVFSWLIIVASIAVIFAASDLTGRWIWRVPNG